jgi:glycosyltransferase involved in cell wall biosynthesis
MADISIVIPTYKRGDKLKCAVTSVLHQTLAPREIIIVDDNQDETENKIVKDCIDSFNDPRLKLIKNFRRKGGCGARNSGILMATGRYIAFLDDDDTFFPDALQENFNAFEDKISMVYGNCQVVDDLYKVTETTSFKKKLLSFDELIMGNCPPSSSVVMIKRSVLINTGLFDESIPSFQDYDMWLEVSKQHLILSHKGLIAKFIQHDGQRTSIDFSKRLLGLELIVEKWSPEIIKIRRLKSFIDHFTADTYSNSGIVFLTLGNRYRLRALNYFFQAIRLKFFNRRYWKWIVFCLLGGH